MSLIKNKVVFYLASRYITYFIQFITSLIIAAELGPYYMGIWGFVLLLLNYFQQFHLGIANSFNVLYVLHRDDKQKCNDYIGNSLALLFYLGCLVVLFFLYYKIFGISYFDKYHVDKYIIWVCLIAIMQYFVMFFLNLFRVKNQLNKVTFCQSIVVLLNFVCVFFFKGEELIKWLVVGYFVGNLLCIVLAIWARAIPRIKDISFSSNYQKEILKKGLYLFLYNSCFYFIIISIRTFISGNYSVEEFGLFTFSYTLANALMLVLDALMFIVFPKLIGKLSSDNVPEVEKTINYLRSIYITSAHFLIYLALPCFPILLYFFPQYNGAITSLNMIALTILLNANSSGYLELLISHNKEKKAAFLSSNALLWNCILALFFVKVVHVPFSYVIVATLVTYLFFTISVMYDGRKIVGKLNLKDFVLQYFPLRLLIPYILALLLTINEMQNWLFVPGLMFVVLNIKVFKQIVELVKIIIVKPEVVNLD